MKKYLFGIVAIVFAIGLSSFSNRHASRKATGTAYWWYDVLNNSTSGPKINSVQVDKAEAMNSLTQCDDSNTPYCLYGSSNPNLNNFNFGSSFDPDQLIRDIIH